MIVAHVSSSGGGGGGGGGLRFVLLLAGLAVVAVSARMRTGERAAGLRRWLPAALAALGAVLAIGGVTWPVPDRPDVTLTLLSPDPDATVPANQPVPVEVQVDGAKVAMTPTDEGEHLHLYLDGKLQSMPYGTKTEVVVPPGRHTVRVELADERHVAYDPPIAVEVVVNGR